MLAYNEIKPKKYIVLGEEPFEVLESLVFRKQKRKPVNQTKLRNLKTDKVVEKSFHQSDTVEEAEIQKKPATFLFKKSARGGNGKNEFWFCEENNPRERFCLYEENLGINQSLLKENSPVEMLIFNEEILGIRLPIKITLEVTEAPPTVKGNTAQGGSKQVTLETGVTINAPLFIKVGDVIVVNTETGEYAGKGSAPS